MGVLRRDPPGELVQVGLPDVGVAGVLEQPHDLSARVRDAVAEDQRAVGRADPGRVEQVLYRERNALAGVETRDEDALSVDPRTLRVAATRRIESRSTPIRTRMRAADDLPMFSTARLAVPIILVATALFGANAASAADWCVSPDVDCAMANNVATLQNALSVAANSPGPDRIFLGAATYTAPTTTGYSYYKTDGQIELIGKGKASTIVTCHPGTGVLTGDGGATIRDSDVTGFSALVSNGDTTIERTHMDGAQYGLWAQTGLTTVRSSFIETIQSGARGAEAVTSAGHPATSLVLDGVTINGLPGGYAAVYATTFWDPTQTVDVSIDNALIRGYGSTLNADASGVGNAHISAVYSDYAPTTIPTGGNGTISEANISNYGDNAGIDADTLIPLDGSRLIDAGDP